MGNIGDSISQPIPAVGEAGTGYATKIVNFLTEVKTRLEAKLPVSSIAVALLDMANNAFQNVQYLGLYDEVSQPSTPVGSLQRYQGNLWYVSSSGAFAITNGASINATSVKGFTGDYGSPNPAEAKFVDADKIFYFYDDFAGGAWASTWQRNVDIAGGNTSSQRLRLKWTAGSSHDIAFATALPGATVGVQISSGGALSYSNAFTGAMSTTGAFTATEFKHTDPLTLHIPSLEAVDINTSHTRARKRFLVAASANEIAFPVVLPWGSRITGWSMFIDKQTNSGATVTAKFYRVKGDTVLIGTETQVGATKTNASNSPGAIVLTDSGLTEDVTGTDAYYLVFTPSGSVTPAADSLYNVLVTYTRP